MNDKIIEKLLRERQATVKSATGRDLVVVKDKAIDALRASLGLGKPKTQAARLTSESGFAFGLLRGQAIPLHATVQSGGQLRIGR